MPIRSHRPTDTTGCERCQENADNRGLVTGAIPLTGALGDRLGQDRIASLEPEEVIPYLTKELHWRIQTVSLIQSLYPYNA